MAIDDLLLRRGMPCDGDVKGGRTEREPSAQHIERERVVDALDSSRRGWWCVRLVRSVLSLNASLYFALLAKAALPTLYTTTRIYFLGQLPQASGVDIASQLYWVNLILEVMQESLIVPLYSCFGETLSSAASTANKVRGGLLITFLSYAVCCGLVAGSAELLVDAMAQNKEHIAATVQYIRWEMLAATIQGLDRFTNVVFVVTSRSWRISWIVILQTVLTIGFDYFFVSDLPGSLRLGVVGIAFSNIGSYAIIMICALIALARDFGWSSRELFAPLNWSWLASWWRVGRWSAAIAFVRNFTYIVFVARMVNVMGQPGTYWIANNFVWSWLLLPFLPLAELLKQEVACMERLPGAHFRIAPAFFFLSTLLFGVWLASIPGWPLFFKTVLNVQQPAPSLELANWLVPYYFAYMIATLFDSIFYGYGLTDPVAVVTVVTNAGVYGTAWIASGFSVPVLTMQSMAQLFGSGMVVGALVRVLLYTRLFFCRVRTSLQAHAAINSQ